MRRSGFTLIEIMIVVGIIAIMLAGAVMSLASGRGAVQVKEATRGVIQLSRYAASLALLRQRPVVVTFFRDGKVEVRISGEVSSPGGAGVAADPIYREVGNETVLTAAERAAEEDEDEGGADGGYGSTKTQKKAEKGLFYARQVLDPEVLAKEDAYGEYGGVTFTVEVLGEDGEPLDPAIAASLSLRRPERASLFLDGVQRHLGVDQDGVEEEKYGEGEMVSVTYETNGNVNPHRIIVKLADADESDEGFTIDISRSGRATVGDVEEKGAHARRRRR